MGESKDKETHPGHGQLGKSNPRPAGRVGPGLEFLKILLNNRKIQYGTEESDGLDRPYGRSRLRILISSVPS
jgi:hypothetical protein